MGVFAAFITVSVLFLRFFIEQGMIGYNWGENIGTYLHWWFEYIIVGVTIIVVAVPEGLPLAVIISLAYSVRKMLNEKNFVKRLAACEIMGGVNNICSDKTGTLTKNEMTVVSLWQGESVELKVNDASYNIADYIPNEANADLFLQATACNTVAQNATDIAILKMYARFGYKVEEMTEKHIPEPYTRFQFTSKRKKMSTILVNIEDNEHGYDKRLVVKGASEIILDLCDNYMDTNGEKQPLDDEKRQEIRENVIEVYAKNALRTITMAYKDLQEEEGGIHHNQEAEDGINNEVEMGGLTCIAIFGIADVIRPEVPEAVATCQKAGIRVRMVTGDNLVTA